MNVKAYQDGTRFVMVFEDCTPDITECLKAFIKPVMEAKAEVKPMKKEVILKASGYDGMTIAQCLEEKKDAGYAAIAHMMQDFSEEERPIVEENLSNYIKERFLGIDPYEFAEKLTDKQDDTLTLLQKYQSIGTPEEIVERINKLNNLVERSLKHMKELKAYRATGYTPEELTTHTQKQNSRNYCIKKERCSKQLAA